MKDLSKNIRNQNDIATAFAEFVDLVAEVPFGNSDYQNRQAVVNDERTPMRAYRHAALRITNRLNALIEAYYHLRRTDVEIKQIERKIKTEPDELEREMLQLDIDQKRALLPYTKKLITDAVLEIESLYPVIEKIGSVTRAQFEIEEGLHFSAKVGAAPPTKDLYEMITGIMGEFQSIQDCAKAHAPA